MLLEIGLGFLGLLIAWLVGISLKKTLALTPVSLVRGVVAAGPMMGLLLGCYRSRWQPLVRLRQQVELVVRDLFAGCRWYDLALVSLAAGVGEEILFRGALQTWAINWTNPWIGVALVSLLFGLAHALSVTYFVVATVIGVYFGWLAHTFGDLVAPVVAHAAYDFFALMYIQRRVRGGGQWPPAQ
jgi:membrane protease YdiL (CAAX protease family)